MTSAPRRPSTEVADVILDSMDRMFDQLVERLARVSPMTSICGSRSTKHGPLVSSPMAVSSSDGAGDREADPAPVTTIAWRLWHITIDCFDDYTRRFAGDTSDADPTWTLDAAEATSILRDKWAAYRTVVAGRNSVISSARTGSTGRSTRSRTWQYTPATNWFTTLPRSLS